MVPITTFLHNKNSCGVPETPPPHPFLNALGMKTLDLRSVHIILVSAICKRQDTKQAVRRVNSIFPQQTNGRDTQELCQTIPG